MAEWNSKNPTSNIDSNMKSILARVKASRLRSADRLVKAMQKDMRGMLAAEVELNLIVGALWALTFISMIAAVVTQPVLLIPVAWLLWAMFFRKP